MPPPQREPPFPDTKFQNAQLPLPSDFRIGRRRDPHDFTAYEGYGVAPPAGISSMASLDNLMAAADEGGDLTSELHGGWTAENAKGRLMGYLQQTRQDLNFNVSNSGPSHRKY